MELPLPNHDRLQDFTWQKNWSGDFGFIVSSIMSWQYTQVLKKDFTIGLQNVVITNKRGYTTCYYVKEELDAFGTNLAQKVREKEFSISSWAGNLVTSTDNLTNIFAQADAGINGELYSKFCDAMNQYGSSHRFVRVVVDYLTKDELKEYFEKLQEVRIYSEHVFDNALVFSKKIAQQIANAKNYSFDAVQGLTKTEIDTYFTTGELPDEQMLATRFNQSMITIFDTTEEIIVDNYDACEAGLTNVRTNKKEFTGQSAYKGVVQGIVRIVTDPRNFGTFDKGDILVTGMTRPDYVPLMERSGAVITDAGGLLCHAAITAREMKIPTVIGTQIATKVLKDCDRVEVDANTGIVTIL